MSDAPNVQDSGVMTPESESAGRGPLEQRDEDIIFEIREMDVAFEMNRGRANVIDGIDIDIYRGETLGIVGESGSGKSMFAAALLDAVVEPGVLTGEIRYYPEDGEPINLLDLSNAELRRIRWEEIAMVFQGAMGAFNPTMTIGEHFEETIVAHGYDQTDGWMQAHQLISDLHMDPDRVLDSFPHELSGGQKQRALIALSLVLDPEVLVMDEPTAALDLLMQRSILNLLYDIKDKYDISIIFISHDIPIVSGFADRLAVMYAFQFVEVGPAQDVLREPAHPYTRSLLKSTPNLSTPMVDMEPIEGESPDPVNPPAGCSYHPRCPLADSVCSSNEPPMEPISDGHEAACYHWEHSEEVIPLSFRDTGDATIDGVLTDIDGPATMTEDGEAVVSIEDIDVHFSQTSLIATIIPDAITNRLGRDQETETVHAVDSVDLEISSNDVVALVGESGCGKTTLGKVAVALQRPTGGSVKYRGADIWSVRDGRVDGEFTFEEIRRSLQIIHQDPDNALNPYHTVQEILSMPMRRWAPGLNHVERRQRISSMLTRVGITPPDDYIERYPHQLSGGEKQRVALIRALLMEPDLILADEAVSALDVSLRIEIMDLMLELQELFETSYLFISHNLSNARYLAGMVNGNIAVMYLGKLVEYGPAQAVIANPKHPYTQVLKWATPVLDPERAAESMRETPPMRGIDIPDATNPPSGCRFHTRCPEAREACMYETPPLMQSAQDDETHPDQLIACFREDPNHEYWESASIAEEPSD